LLIFSQRSEPIVVAGSQFEGKAISKLILSPESAINEEKSIRFLQGVLAL
jgi:hypothetical protein